MEVSMRRWSECLVTQAKGKARESGVVVNKRDSYTSLVSFVKWVSCDGLCSVCYTMCYWCYRERYKDSRDSRRGCESVNASIA